MAVDVLPLTEWIDVHIDQSQQDTGDAASTIVAPLPDHASNDLAEVVENVQEVDAILPDLVDSALDELPLSPDEPFDNSVDLAIETPWPLEESVQDVPDSSELPLVEDWDWLNELVDYPSSVDQYIGQDGSESNDDDEHDDAWEFLEGGGVVLGSSSQAGDAGEQGAQGSDFGTLESQDGLKQGVLSPGEPNFTSDDPNRSLDQAPNINNPNTTLTQGPIASYPISSSASMPSAQAIEGNVAWTSSRASSPLAASLAAENAFRRFSSLEMIPPPLVGSSNIRSSINGNSELPKNNVGRSSIDTPRYFSTHQPSQSMVASRPNFSGQQMAHFLDKGQALNSPTIGHAKVGLFSVVGDVSAKFERISRSYFVPLKSAESSPDGVAGVDEMGVLAGTGDSSNWLTFGFGDAERVDSRADQNRLILFGLLAFVLEKVRSRAKCEQDQNNSVTFIPKFNLRR